MDENEPLKLIERGESEKLELKPSLSQINEIVETVSGMANAKVLAKVRYIEELGEGWDKMVKEHREHPLKPEMPKIDADKYSMTVTIFSTKEGFEEEKKAELNERQKKAIEFLRENGKISRKQYVALCGCSERTALNDLVDLVKMDLVESRGVGKGTYYEIRAKIRNLEGGNDEAKIMLMVREVRILCFQVNDWQGKWVYYTIPK